MTRNILVPVDTSSLSEQAALKAGAIARLTEATVHLVHVYESPFPAFDGGYVLNADFLAADRARFEKSVRRIAADVVQQYGCRCEVSMVAGSAAEEIARYARDENVELIVMSTHGRTGFSRAWFGSVADALARDSSTPVLMVRYADPASTAPQPHSDPPFRSIMIALDGSEVAERVLPYLQQTRLLRTADVTFVEIVNPVPLPPVVYPDAGLAMSMAQDIEATNTLKTDAEAYLAGVARRFEYDGARSVETSVCVAPNTGAAIATIAQTLGADLVAITSHGRGASRLIVGSVADKVLRGTSGSVFLIRTT